MHSLIHLPVVALILWLLYRQQPDRLFVPALIFRMFAGLAFAWIYFSYYGSGDTFFYHRLATDLSEHWQSLFPWNLSAGAENEFVWPEQVVGTPRNMLFIRFLAVLAVITGGSYLLMALYLNLLVFIAGWFLYKEIISAGQKYRTAAAVSILFLPGLVFWTSGVLKEPLITGMFFCAITFLIRIIRWKGTMYFNLAGLILAIFLFFSLRYFVAAVFIFFLCIYFVFSRLLLQRSRRWLISIPLLLGMVFALSQSHPNLNPDRLATVIRQNQLEFRQISRERNLLKYPFTGEGWENLLLNVPLAIGYGFFAPFPWQVHNLVSFFAMLESFTIFGLALWLAFSKPSLDKFPLILLLVLVGFCLTMAAGLALSAPNTGSLVRYRIVFTPVLVFLLVYFLKEKFNKAIKAVNR